MAWNYERKENNLGKIPAGRHRLRIEDAEMTESKAGNDMIKLTLSVSGQSRTMWDYIVFMEDKPEITNGKFTAIYDSFGIPEGEFDLSKWVGAVGAGQTKIDENDYEKVQYYIKKDKQGDLPNWVEPKLPESVRESKSSGTGGYPLPKEDDEDLPF